MRMLAPYPHGIRGAKHYRTFLIGFKYRGKRKKVNAMYDGWEYRHLTTYPLGGIMVTLIKYHKEHE